VREKNGIKKFKISWKNQKNFNILRIKGKIKNSHSFNSEIITAN